MSCILCTLQVLEMRLEHFIDDEYFPLEAHFVHQKKDSKKLMVIGVLFEFDDCNDSRSRFLDQLMPFVKEANAQGPGTSNLKSFNMTRLKLSSFWKKEVNDMESGFYAYMGSLTTPPCDPGVQWVVAEDKAKMNTEQFNQLKKQLRFNARLPQPNRQI